MTRPLRDDERGDGMLQWAKGTTGVNAGRPRSLDVQADLLLDVLDGKDVDTCCVRFSPSGRLVRARRPGDSRFVRLLPRSTQVGRRTATVDGRQRLMGLVAVGDPMREVWFAWSAKEVVRQFYDHTPRWPRRWSRGSPVASAMSRCPSRSAASAAPSPSGPLRSSPATNSTRNAGHTRAVIQAGALNLPVPDLVDRHISASWPALVVWPCIHRVRWRKRRRGGASHQ